MLLALDTESTGLQSNSSARPIQLGFVVLDSHGAELEAVSLLIKTVSNVPAASARIHSIDSVRLAEEGVPPAEGLRRLFDAMERVTSAGGVCVAFNAEFDCDLIARACADAGLKPPVRPVGCVMRLLAPRLKLAPFRNGSFKFPRLGEAASLLGVDRVGDAHDALSDARRCAGVYLAARARGWV